jgi:hypothetical protein
MIEINDRHFPLLVFRFSGEVSLPELEDYLKRQEEFFARGQPMVSVALTHNLKIWEPKVLRRQATWMKDHSELLRKYLVGAAMVITTPAVRGMLKAIMWIQPIHQPYKVCADIPEALEWLRNRCREAGVAIKLPPTL